LAKARVRAKRAYHHGDLRESVIAAAVQIIGKRGPKALTLRSVAHRLGVSQTAPYRHFASKEALLAAVAAEGFRTLEKRIEAEMVLAGGDPVERFRAIGIAYMAFAIEHPAHFTIMYAARPPEFSQGPVADASRHAFKLTKEAVERCQREGRAPKGDPSRIVVAAWAFVHGLAMLYENGQLPKNYDVKSARSLARQIPLFLRSGLDQP
jgi:AcrR family transcriptional regulator